MEIDPKLIEMLPRENERIFTEVEAYIYIKTKGFKSENNLAKCLSWSRRKVKKFLKLHNFCTENEQKTNNENVENSTVYSESVQKMSRKQTENGQDKKQDGMLGILNM